MQWVPESKQGMNKTNVGSILTLFIEGLLN